MKWYLLATYVGLLHLLVAVLWFKPGASDRLRRRLGGEQAGPEFSEHYRNMVQYHARMDPFVPDKAVIFLGDSLIQSLYVEAVACPAVNYGIGNDTTAGLRARLPRYGAVERASTIVIAIGGNDLKYWDNHHILTEYRQLLEALPHGVPIICCGVLPVQEALRRHARITNQRIADFNAALRSLCAADPRCRYLDLAPGLQDSTGNLATNRHEGDGVHLNREGASIVVEELRRQLEHPEGTP